MNDGFLTVQQAIRRALDEELERDPNVLVMGQDIGVYGGAFGVTAGLLEKYGPARIRETPISEAGTLGLAIGAALMGLRPIVEFMFMDFIALAMDQLANHAAKLSFMYGGQTRVPLVIRAPFGAGRGYGASHSQSLEAWLVHVPGLKVVAPSSPQDSWLLMKRAIRDDNPVVFLEHKLLYGVKGTVSDRALTVNAPMVGESVVARIGSDVTLVGYARQLHVLVSAADILYAHGLSAEVIDVPVLKPLDLSCVIASVRRTHRLVVAEEAPPLCSVGTQIAERVYAECFEDLLCPVARFSGKDTPIPAATALEAAYLPQAEEIVACVHQMVQPTAGSPTAVGYAGSRQC